MSKTVSYTEARDHLKTYLDYVTQNNDIVTIQRKDGSNVVLISEEDYKSMDETDYLMSTKANRENLLATIQDIKDGNNEGSVTFESVEALKMHYGL